MSVRTGRNGQLEIVVSQESEELYDIIREQLELDEIMSSIYADPEKAKNNNGKYNLASIGIGYWDESRLGADSAPAKGTYHENIVHNHTKGDNIPPRMYFETEWNATFNGDKVKLRTTINGHGEISFTIPHDGLWAVKSDALS